MSCFSHVEIQGMLPKSNSVPIPSISYEAVTRKPNHQWDLENYVALIILADECSNSWAEKTLIFNAYFRDQLISSIGLSEGALRSMYYKIQNLFVYPIGRWKTLKATLEEVAFKIGLHLELKPHSEPLKNNATPETDGDCRNLPHTLARNRIHGSRSQRKGKKQSSRSIPKLAFRAFDETSQGINSSTHFRAGIFVNREVTSPPHPSSHLYRCDARRHIRRIHQGSTPMISVSSSIVRVLHIALKTEISSHVAVIDLWEAGKVAHYDNDGDNPYIQEVYRLNLNPGDPYKGIGEYLVWGSIDSKSIITVIKLSEHVQSSLSVLGNLNPFSLDLLRSSAKLRQARIKISKRRLPLNFETGQCVGRLIKLLKIPNYHFDSAVYCIVEDWTFCKYKSWRSNQDFVDGIYRGLQIQAPPSREQSPTRVTTAFINELKQAALELQDMDFEYSMQPAEQSFSFSPAGITYGSNNANGAGNAYGSNNACGTVNAYGSNNACGTVNAYGSNSAYNAGNTYGSNDTYGAFMNDLRQAALELKDTDLTSRASTPSTATLQFSQDMNTLTTTAEIPAYEEPESKSPFADNFLNELREAAEFDFSSGDERNEYLMTEDQIDTKERFLFF